MKFSALPSAILLAFVLVACTQKTPAKNPDPNHTHADFAVWIDGTQMDFSGSEFMSGSSNADDPDHQKHDEYLHLHDENGSVIHKHKSGFTLADFFATLKVGFTEKCFSSGVPMQDGEVCSENPFRLFVNGTEQPFDDLRYVFSDEDKILITNTTDDLQVRNELQKITDDACLYSKTCPERGEPPAENCIADPEVPCTQ